MAQGRADSASIHVRLEAQGHCAAGQAPAHSRYLRPFAFFALSLVFYRLPGAMAGQLGLCQRASGCPRQPWRDHTPQLCYVGNATLHPLTSDGILL
jgi:hypothetical protein